MIYPNIAFEIYKGSLCSVICQINMAKYYEQEFAG